MRARNRELIGLIPASLLLTAGFAGVFIQRSSKIPNLTLTYGAIFLGLCVAGHVFVRITLPHADPYMFPLVAVLASFGIVMIYRISTTDARQQAQWFVLGLILFAATIVIFRDYRKLEQYRYVIVFSSLGLLILPRLPGIGYQANGAYLGVRIPGLFVFQPAEFAKIGLVIFLASYLRDTRQVMVMGARRILGVTIPPIKHFGPGARDLGDRDGDHVPAARHRLVADVLRRSARGAVRRDRPAVVRGRRTVRVRDRRLVRRDAHRPHPRSRRLAWLHPFNPTLYHKIGGSYQQANALFAQAAGRLLRPGLRRGDPDDSGQPSDGVSGARAAHGHDLRGDHRRAGTVRGRRGDPHLPAVRRARVQDGNARAATRSRRCWRWG